jgi:hypothetical protein
MNNYKGEKYFTCSPKLLKDLNAISKNLVENLRAKGKSYQVKEIINSKSFNELWNVIPKKSDNKHSRNEYKGIYAFAVVGKSKIDFKYVGISQTIRRRFTGHTKRKTRQAATWAYMMIKKDFPELSIKQRERKISAYQKTIIYPLQFTFYPIDDNMMLHIAEVYCVNKLKAFWNSFETH